MLRVYVEENHIEEDHNNVEECQQDMFNDEFHPATMSNPDDEIVIGEGEAQTEGSDLESKFPPTPIVSSNNPCASQTSRVNNVKDDETGFYKGMKFKN